MRLTDRSEMRPDSRALRAEQFLVPSNREGALICLMELQRVPQIPHKSRRTLMSPQESDIAQGSPNQLEIEPDSPALAPEQFPVPHHTRQVA